LIWEKFRPSSKRKQQQKKKAKACPRISQNPNPKNNKISTLKGKKKNKGAQPP